MITMLISVHGSIAGEPLHAACIESCDAFRNENNVTKSLCAKLRVYSLII